MNRSRGVTASAVIAIFGSCVCFLFSAFTLVTAVTMPSLSHVPVPERQPAVASPIAAMVFVSVLYMGFAVWGITSAIGLLRLRNWARISFLIFAGILCFIALCGAFGAAVYVLMAPPPNVPNPAPGVMVAVLGIFLAIALLFCTVGVWWLIYFNRAGVKAQFIQEAGPAAANRGPLSLTIIAWLLIIGGVFIPLQILLGYPILMFGFIFRGWLARAILLLLAGVSLAAGIGMLRKRSQALSLAIGFYTFGILNVFSYLVVPGSVARLQELTREMTGPALQANAEAPILWFGLVAGTLFSALALWFLITRRSSFIAYCQADNQPGLSQS